MRLQGTEQNRHQREAFGTLGTIEKLCRIIKRSELDDSALMQHWATLGQLCLCPQNAATSAREEALLKAKEVLGGTSASSELRTTVSLYISTAAGFCTTKTLKEIVSADLVPVLTAAVMKASSARSGERDERDWAVSTLTALARNAALKPELLEAGLEDAFSLLLIAENRKLGPKAEKPTEAYIKGSFGLACLVGQEENHPAIGKDLDRCIRWMVRDLQAALDGEPWPEKSRPTLWVVTHGIASMASADCNKDKLGEAGVIPLLVRVLTQVDTTSTDGAWAEENATAALWALAFTEANKTLMLEQEEALSDQLQRICERSCEHSDDSELSFAVLASMRRTKIDAGYCLWLLGLVDESDEEIGDDSSEDEHIMISYAEPQLDLARDLWQRLTDAGYNAWLDIESNKETPAAVKKQKTRTNGPRDPVPIMDDSQLRRSVFISHSRRDPAAVNIAYCIIYALRYATDEVSGEPLCPVTYLPGEPSMWLWVDKEQMADAGGQDWVQMLTKAQKHAAANWFMLGNAYIGSSECMKEFLYADAQKFNFIPVFIESFARDAEEFESKKAMWKVDSDLVEFDKWEAKKDMIDRLACSRQGVVAGLDVEDFVCDLCRDSRDQVCYECCSWERILATPSGTRMRESVETLARYITKESQLASGGDTVGTMTEGVAKASSVIVLCSKDYKFSPAARTEAMHAKTLGKHVSAPLPPAWICRSS